MLFTFIFVTLVGWLINKHLDKLRLGLSAVFFIYIEFFICSKIFFIIGNFILILMKWYLML